MTSVAGRTANADRSSPAVLCGVEALSAQQRAVGAFFALRGVFRTRRPGGEGTPEQEFAEPILGYRANVKGEGKDADDQPADRKSAHGTEVAQEGARAAAIAAEAGRLHARLPHDAEEAELGAAQGRQGAPDQRVRGDRLHPG